MKKRIILILTAVMLISVGMAAAALPALANSDIEINSTGSLVLEGGDVLFDAKDIEDMKTQVDNLCEDLPAGAYTTLEEGILKNGLNSKGIINYGSRKVIFDASDFIKLADGIDSLKTCYQSEVVKSLKSIHTYFKADGAVTHVESDAVSSDDALKLTFGQICNGILKSQSLEHLAGENILPASSDNLSEGSAAWVNGDIVIGTGNDNKASYEQGYEKGYEDGASAGLDGKCYYLGIVWDFIDGSFYCNVRDRAPEVDYTKLTVDNFILCPCRISENTVKSTAYLRIEGDLTPYCSIPGQEFAADGLDYNSKTGWLTYKPPKVYAYGGLLSVDGYEKIAEANMAVSIYIYTGDIINS